MSENHQAPGDYTAVLWSSDGKPMSLDYYTIRLRVAYGIGAGGHVAAVGDCAEQGSACLWHPGGLIPLASLGYDGQSEPRAVNSQGHAVGWAEVPPSGRQHAVLWRDGEGTDLGTLGGVQSEALDIDNTGRVVGWARPPSNENSVSTRHAFLWENGTMTDLGTLGTAESIAFGINDSGQVVGWLGDFYNKRAFLWETGTMTLLPPGTQYSQALDINNRGDIVGTYIVSGTTHHAALWRDGVRYDLNDMVGDPRLNLDLANAINDVGQIVGVGAWKSDGREFGFLLTPIGTR
jgi:probable HAF family extracellular repeat protein